MSRRLFVEPVLRPGYTRDELNALLAERRILTLQREFIASGAQSHGMCCAGQADACLQPVAETPHVA